MIKTWKKLNKLCSLIKYYHYNSFWKIGISYGSFETIFTNVLNIKRVATKRVPKLQQKQYRVAIVENLVNDKDLFKRVITDDDMWVYSYDIETKF